VCATALDLPGQSCFALDTNLLLVLTVGTSWYCWGWSGYSSVQLHMR
jgi:hypothetical protein